MMQELLPLLTLAQDQVPNLDQISEQMGSVKSAVDKLAQALPAAFDIALGFAALWGIFLWLFGNRIVRSSLVFVALLIGAAVGGLVGRSMGDNTTVIIAVVVGAIGVAVFAWITFRLWVAVLLSVTLGVCTPWAVLAWKGEPLPRVHQPFTDVVKDAADQAKAVIKPNADGDTDNADAGDDDAQSISLTERLSAAADETVKSLRTWWGEQHGALRMLMVVGGLGMMVGGFFVGLVFPNLAAAIVASLVGSSLVITALLRLSAQYAQGLHDKLPSTPRGVLVMLVSATIIGALIQWTVLGKRADN